MKDKKHREIMVVPRGGGKIKTIRLRSKLMIFLFFLIAAGFAGYLIPFNTLSVEVIEQNQQKNLESQNKKMVAAIRPMHRSLDHLNEEILRLDGKRKEIADRVGLQEADRQTIKRKSKQVQQSSRSLLGRASRTEKIFIFFAELIKKRPALFDSIPLIKPIIENPVKSATFGKEKDPFTQQVKNHGGIDYIAPRGTSVVSSASGVVTRVEDGKLWGKRIFIENGFGFSTVYAHLGTVDAFTGKSIKKGDNIGTVGLSGMTSGPHLHYEVWYRGVAINPEELLFPVSDSVMALALR